MQNVSSRVVVRHWTVPFPTLQSRVRIAHVSDLHLRRWSRVYQDAQCRLNELDYDILVVTGDLCDDRPGEPDSDASGWRRALDLSHRFFEPLAGKSPILGVLGNHDDPQIAESGSLPIQFLNNESTIVGVGAARVLVAGVDQSLPGRERLDEALADPGDPSADNPQNDAGFGDTAPNRGTSNRISELISGPIRDLPTVLLAHYPSTIFRVKDDRVRLVLSGHTHGGQIRFPGLGCLWSNDAIPRKQARGLHRLSGRFLHVTAGIGVSLPIRLRFHCPPEVALLNLVPGIAAKQVESASEKANQDLPPS